MYAIKYMYLCTYACLYVLIQIYFIDDAEYVEVDFHTKGASDLNGNEGSSEEIFSFDTTLESATNDNISCGVGGSGNGSGNNAEVEEESDEQLSKRLKVEAPLE